MVENIDVPGDILSLTKRSFIKELRLLQFLNRHSGECKSEINFLPIHRRIVTCGERWIYLHNPSRQQSTRIVEKRKGEGGAVY
ncbi:hypothetical protein Trydic_g3512 [Trypoxylus dichotomus]